PSLLERPGPLRNDSRSALQFPGGVQGCRSRADRLDRYVHLSGMSVVHPDTAILVSIVLVVATAVTAVVGLFLIDSRPRHARRLEDDIVGHACATPALRGIRVTVSTRVPAWRGPMDLDLGGTVASTAQRDLVMSIATHSAAACGRIVRVNDAMRVVPAEG